jgi:hypothetical protein
MEVVNLTMRAPYFYPTNEVELAYRQYYEHTEEKS